MKATITIQQIMSAVSTTTTISFDQMKGIQRFAFIVDARRIVSGIAYRLGFSYADIGIELNRDRSSIRHLCETFTNYFMNDLNFRESVKPVLNNFNLNFKATIMKNITFDSEPDLWPESHTDLFSFDQNANPIEVEDCIEAALIEADRPHNTQIGIKHIATDSQLLVEALTDQLYGYEIPFRHLHIPAEHG